MRAARQGNFLVSLKDEKEGRGRERKGREGKGNGGRKKKSIFLSSSNKQTMGKDYYKSLGRPYL